MSEKFIKPRASLVTAGVFMALFLSACGVQNIDTPSPLDEAFEAAPVAAASNLPSTPIPTLPKASPTSVPALDSKVAPIPSPSPVQTEESTIASIPNVGATTQAIEIIINSLLPHRVAPGENISFSASFIGPGGWARPEVFYPNSAEPILLEVQEVDDGATIWSWKLPSDVQEGDAKVVLNATWGNEVLYENGQPTFDPKDPLYDPYRLYTDTATFIVDLEGTRGPLTLELSPDLDTDQDGHTDTEDNCPFVSNPDQLDSDGDSRGSCPRCLECHMG